MLYGGAQIVGDDSMSDAALRTAAALTISGFATGAIKMLVGRGRPNNPLADGNDFRPLVSEDAWASFPSGHVMTAFMESLGALIRVMAHFKG